jgi:putative ABC transport system substrate-binding protein
MRRRAVLASVLMAPAAMAQTRPRIALLVNEGTRSRFAEDLRAAGIRLDQEAELDVVRYAGGDLTAAARALAARHPAVLVTSGSPAAVALHAAAPATPLVVLGSDPVALGLARSLAQPGGMVTGITILGPELDAKRLELLAETLPGQRHLAGLLLEGSPLAGVQAEAMAQVAQRLGRDLTLLHAPPLADAALAARLTAIGAGGLVIGASPRFSNIAAELAALAQRLRLPTACQWRAMAEAGCLLSYGPDLAVLWRRAAEMVAQILRGTPPGRIPVEQPSRFELVINLATARAIGVEVPLAVLARADQVIE